MSFEAHKTDIYLVTDLADALRTAVALEAEAVALDVEGVLGNFVGNEPYPNMTRDFLHGDGAQNFALAHRAIENNPNTCFGLATNNMNKQDTESDRPGLVTVASERLGGLSYVHKGMKLGKTVLGAKPSGEQTTALCESMEVAPARTVLIDDQGVKNAGEAVKAGLMAIIVPNPIGLPVKDSDRVVEHKWVSRARKYEPRIYESLEQQGRLARVAYKRLAGIDISSIGEFYDLRHATKRVA